MVSLSLDLRRASVAARASADESERSEARFRAFFQAFVLSIPQRHVAVARQT